MTVHRTLEEAASKLSALAAQSRHDRKILNGLTTLRLPLVAPTSPLEERALAQATQIIERWRNSGPANDFLLTVCSQLRCRDWLPGQAVQPRYALPSWKRAIRS